MYKTTASEAASEYDVALFVPSLEIDIDENGWRETNGHDLIN